jgi:tRNA A37 threonylcarbamoyladenosine dehydratase
MLNPFQRIALLTGTEAAEALEKCKIIVVGIGGVGSWAAEALVRSGAGNVSLADHDSVSVTNINRQIQATGENIGRLKTEALEEHLRDINPSCRLTSIPRFFSKETAELFNIPGADFVIDAIDTLESKLDLIETSLASGKRLFSSMGMALKLDPTLIRTADIWESSGCPLARLVRQGLRKRNCNGNFTVVYSSERIPRTAKRIPETARGAIPDSSDNADRGGKRMINGSAVTVTAAAGMILASLVIRDICPRFGGESNG